MRFQVPFQYWAKYRLYRRRTMQNALRESWIDIEIEEIADAGDPAFVLGFSEPPEPSQPPGTWTRYVESYWRPFSFRNGRPVRVWRVEGTCYVEYCPVEEFPARITLWDDNPFDAKDSEGTAHPIETTRGWILSYESLSENNIVKIWQDDLGVAKANRIQRRSLSMRVIDGHVCVAAGEPECLVHSLHGIVTVSIVESVAHEADGLRIATGRSYGRRFRIEEFDHARQFAEALAEREQRDVLVDASVVKAEPTGPFLPRNGYHLSASAYDLSNVLWHRHPFSGIVRLRARDLDAALRECPTDHATEALAMALEDLLIEVETPPSAHWCHEAVSQEQLSFFDFDPELPGLVRQAKSDLEKWRSRMPDRDDWSDRALSPAAECSTGIEQLLSAFAMQWLAQDMSIPPVTLEQELHAGNLLLSVWVRSDKTAGRRQVAVIDPDLRIVRFVGPFGHPDPLPQTAVVEAFLVEVERRRAGLMSLAALSLD